MESIVRYPVGEQSFEALRTRGLLYVDKTRFIEKILNTGGKYFFLGRPRRFGKSLWLSTLECFFQGKRELFKGLYIEGIDWERFERPVLHIDLNVGEYSRPEHLNMRLGAVVGLWEKEYGLTPETEEPSLRMESAIRRICELTGRKVVILVDEYDKPLVHNLSNRELFEQYRETLAAFYSNFKSSARYIELVFLTGVSRFGHLSVFSGLNNISDISFNNEYSDICGITEDELQSNFGQGIAMLAECAGISEEAVLGEIKLWYDGYRFSDRGKEIYNPYSVLSLMQDRSFQNYWIYSGQPTLLVQQLRRYDVDIEKLTNAECSLAKLNGFDLDNAGLEALFYQTGYLTIKDYDPTFRLVKLGIPNREVSEGLFSYLLPFYISRPEEPYSDMFVKNFVLDLRSGDADGFMRRLQSFFSSISYEMNMDRERNFQNALLVLFKLLGIYVEAEKRTSHGRIDLFLATDKFYFIIELKFNGSARGALNQIDDKNYALPFSAGKRRIIKIGADFSPATRTISDWLISE